MTELEEKFQVGMEDVYHSVKRESGYVASRYLQMVRGRGGVEAAKRLLHKDGVSSGFLKLAEHGCLHLSMEALILRPEFEPLFTDGERAVCRDRLLEHGFDPDRQ